MLSLSYEHGMDKFFQFINWIITILVAFIGVITSQLNDLQLGIYISWAAWSAPGIIFFMFCILLFQYYEVEGLIRKCRIVMDEINERLASPILTQFSNMGYMSKFFSTRHGNVKYRILIWAEFFLCGILYLIASGLSLIHIYAENHFWGFIITVIFIMATFLLVYSFSGSVVDLPEFYEFIRESLKRKDSQRNFTNIETVIRPSLKKLQAIILPRPRDVFDKGVVFWFGFIAALTITGLQNHQLITINRLFRYQQKDFTILSLPPWTILGLGLVYFFVEEILLQQAKLLWDDIRDIKRDQLSIHHNLRAFTQGLMSENSAIIHVLSRWALSLILGYLLGGTHLLGLFILISLHQAMYVLWGKPRSEKKPLTLLIIISFNVSFRFVAGVMAVVGPSWSYLPFLVLIAIFHFYSFGFMAALWKMEAFHIRNTPHPQLFERPQSYFFYSNGEALRYQGQVGAIILSAVFFAVQIMSTFRTNLYWVGHLFYKDFLYMRFNNLIGFALILTIIIFVHFLTFIVKIMFSRVIKPIKLLLRKIKTIVTIVSYSSFLACLFWAATGKYPLIYFGGIFFMNLGLLTMLEDMKYEDFVAQEVFRQIPHLFNLWSAYLFKPPQEGLTMRSLILITIKVFNNVSIFPR